MGESITGKLLVATPSLRDGVFDRAVLFVLQHDRDGALAVVLNRPSESEVAELLPSWRAVATAPRIFFIGGPVDRSSAICLGLLRHPEVIAGFAPTTGLVGTVDLDGDPDQIGQALAALRVFVGYAGWEPGQLEEEIAQGAWFVVDSLPTDAFSPEPELLWNRVLRRQVGPLAYVSTYTPDAAMN